MSDRVVFGVGDENSVLVEERHTLRRLELRLGEAAVGEAMSPALPDNVLETTTRRTFIPEKNILGSRI